MNVIGSSFKKMLVFIDGFLCIFYLLICFVFQAKLQPSQDITIYYDTMDGLSKIIHNYPEFIHTTTKQPLCRYPVKPGTETIISDKAKVSAKLYFPKIVFVQFLCHHRINALHVKALFV